MKFPVNECECGQDLTKVAPVRKKIGVGPNGESIGGCPNCWRTYYLVEDAPKGKSKSAKKTETAPEPNESAPEPDEGNPEPSTEATEEP